MPKVGKKRFPYTPGGKRAAEKYRKTVAAANGVKKKKVKKKPTRYA
jgi:hypothetical protein